MNHFDQPVPAFLDSLSSKVKLQGAGDQHKSTRMWKDALIKWDYFHMQENKCLTIPAYFVLNMAYMNTKTAKKVSIVEATLASLCVQLVERVCKTREEEEENTITFHSKMHCDSIITHSCWIVD